MVPSLLGVLLALGIVLLVLGVGLRLVQRFVPSAVVGRPVLQAQVVQRLSLSPRQGIAFVRAGTRVIAVSVGEGGVRRLFELDDEEAAELLASRDGAAAQNASRPARGSATSAQQVPAMARPGEATPRRGMQTDFRSALAAAMRSAAPASEVRSAAPAGASVPPAAAKRRLTLGWGILLILAALAGAAAIAPLLAQGATAASSPPGPAQRPPAQGVAAPTTRPTLPASPQPIAPAQATTPVQATTPAAGTGNAVATASQVVTRLAPQLDLQLGTPGAAGAGGAGGVRLSGTVGVVVMLGLLTLLPTLVLMMTSFTRILLVLHFVKQGVGTQTGLPNQLIAALALILTFFVMGPTLSQVNRDAITPWMDGRMEQGEMLEIGAKPLRAFMLRQTRPSDVRAFVRMSGAAPPASLADVPLVTLMSAFATSELRTAFAIGFAVLLPFLVIDVVVSSTLMSMGFVMLPPAMVSLPFKLLLFVLVDGWSLVMQSLVTSFR